MELNELNVIHPENNNWPYASWEQTGFIKYIPYFKQLHHTHFCVSMCNNVSVTLDKSICIIFIGNKFWNFTLSHQCEFLNATNLPDISKTSNLRNLFPRGREDSRGLRYYILSCMTIICPSPGYSHYQQYIP